MRALSLSIATRAWSAGIVAFGLLTSCSGNIPTAQKQELVGAPSTPEYVGAQSVDLPTGFVRCDYSGNIDGYLRRMESIALDKGKGIGQTWNELKAAGARDASIVVYAESPESCTTWVAGAPAGHVHAKRRIVSTVVVKFDDVSTAEAAYRADIFKQSMLAGQPNIRVLAGTATGLSPNSVVGADEQAVPPVYQAVWQRDVFNIFFSGRNLTPDEFVAVTLAVNNRVTATGNG